MHQLRRSPTSDLDLLCRVRLVRPEVAHGEERLTVRSEDLTTTQHNTQHGTRTGQRDGQNIETE